MLLLLLLLPPLRVKLPEAAMIVFFFDGVDRPLDDGVEEVEDAEGVRGAEEGVRGVREPLDRALPRWTGVRSPDRREGEGV